MTKKHTYRCGNCDYATDDRDDLSPLADLELRIESDDIMGAGECPECGAMVFDTTGHNYRAIHNHDELLKALRAIVEYASDWETGCDDPRDIRDAEDEHASAIEAARLAITKATT